jgi:hypothetical protein
MRRVALIAGLAAVLGCTERVRLPGAFSIAQDAGGEPESDGAYRDGAYRDGAYRSDASGDVDSGGAGGNDACQGQLQVRSLPVSRDIPKLIIALDLSMANATASSGTLLQVAQQSLSDLLPSYEGAIQFGYEPFPARTCSDGTCCAAMDLRVKPIGAMADEIRRELTCDVSGACRLASDQSPSFSALLASRKYYEAEGSSVSRFVLLLTDHDPLCNGEQSGCEEAVTETSLLASMSVKTVVIGLGAGVDHTDCMARIATKGQWSTAKKPSFANDVATLKPLLKTFFDTVSGHQCQLVLKSKPDTSQVFITFDNGQFVPHDPKRAEGWEFDSGSDTRITIFGTWCGQLTGGQVTSVAAGFLCSTCAGPDACK